jgi:XFP C-terminal domain
MLTKIIPGLTRLAFPGTRLVENPVFNRLTPAQLSGHPALHGNRHQSAFPDEVNLSVRARQEKCNINTPLDLAVNNEIDRVIPAIDAINRVARACRRRPGETRPAPARTRTASTSPGTWP